MRPFKFFTNQELVNVFLVSRISTTPSIIQNADFLSSISARFIGNKATSYYLGNTAGRVFSAGETISELKKTLFGLTNIGLGSIIGYCVEGENTPEGMESSATEIENSIKACADFRNFSGSLKVTSLMQCDVIKKLNSIQLKYSSDVWGKSIFFDYSTEKLLEYGLSKREISDTQEGMERLRKVTKMCADKGVPMLIDAEQTYFQSAIDAMTAALQKEFNVDKGIVLNTFQSYLKKTTKNLESYFAWANQNNLKSGVKLVRGAYIVEETKLAKLHNYECPINVSKEATDDCYNYNLALCVHSHGPNSILCIAGHNDHSIGLGKELIIEKRLHRQLSGISFAQLLGFKSQIGLSLAEENFAVQKYVLFGPFDRMIPFLVRRANEQSAMIIENKNQIAKIEEELRFRIQSS